MPLSVTEEPRSAHVLLAATALAAGKENAAEELGAVEYKLPHPLDTLPKGEGRCFLIGDGLGRPRQQDVEIKAEQSIESFILGGCDRSKKCHG